MDKSTSDKALAKRKASKSPVEREGQQPNTAFIRELKERFDKFK